MNITKFSLWKATLIGICFLAILGLSIGLGVKYYLKYKSASEGLLRAESNMRIYTAVVENQRQTIYETKTRLVTTSRELKRSVEYGERMDALNLRKVSVIADLEIQVNFLKDSLTLYNNTGEVGEVEWVIEAEDSIPMIELPISFGVEDEWSIANAMVGVDGHGTIGFSMLSTPLDITLGQRGVFRKQYVASAMTPNPYLMITSQDITLVQKKSPQLKAGIVGYGLGILSTLAVMIAVN